MDGTGSAGALYTRQLRTALFGIERAATHCEQPSDGIHRHGCQSGVRRGGGPADIPGRYSWEGRASDSDGPAVRHSGHRNSGEPDSRFQQGLRPLGGPGARGYLLDFASRLLHPQHTVCCQSHRSRTRRRARLAGRGVGRPGCASAYYVPAGRASPDPPRSGGWSLADVYSRSR